MMMPLLGDGHCKVDLGKLKESSLYSLYIFICNIPAVNITMRTELIGQEYKKNGANF